MPTNDVRGSKWIQAICRHQEYDFYSKQFTICEEHFTTDDFIKINGKKVLHHNAVPSIFGYPNSLTTNSTLEPEIQDINNGSKFICKIKDCSNSKRVRINDEILFFR